MADEAAKNDTPENQKVPVPKIRHDWYQTETHVVVTILAKNTENAKASYGETSLSVSAKLPNGSDYTLELDLAHHIVPDQCSHKAMPSKIEIKLKKRDGLRWTVLEGNPSQVGQEVQPIPQEILQASQPPTYPSSSKKSKDWNKVEKEIEKLEAEEKPTGDDAVLSLFEQVYMKGSDDVRRAMNKSYRESGGTVLSTNWSEVGQKPTEVVPPSGLEWKTWNS